MSSAYHEAQSMFCARTDPKAWAKRIIYRHEKGDKTLSQVQITFAYQAMGQEAPKSKDAI